MATVLEPEPITQLSPGIPPFPVYRFTVEQYRRMVEMGILDEEEVRTELLEGWIVPKMSKNPAHDTVIELVDECLRSLLPPGWRLRIQSATVNDISNPEPDLSIVRGEIRDYLTRHPGPGDIALAVEVAESSLQRDRWKARIYARAGIPVYWIVNLVDHEIEVHTNPSGPVDDPSYADVEVIAGDRELLLIIDGAEVGRVTAKDLLP